MSRFNYLIETNQLFWLEFLAHVKGRALQGFVFRRYLVNACINSHEIVELLLLNLFPPSSECAARLCFEISPRVLVVYSDTKIFHKNPLDIVVFINKTIHFDHRMSIEGRIVIPESTANT
jgi:hypothetical protein